MFAVVDHEFNRAWYRDLIGKSFLNSPGYAAVRRCRMKVVQCWGDLRQFGIQPLTGEACGYGFRLLCDLDEKARRIVMEFFGMQDPRHFGENWNSGGIASVMFPDSILWDLAGYALVETGCKTAYQVCEPGGMARVYGCVTDEEIRQMEEFLKEHPDQFRRRYEARGTGPGGSRNVHEMSGRVT